MFSFIAILSSLLLLLAAPPTFASDQSSTETNHENQPVDSHDSSSAIEGYVAAFGGFAFSNSFSNIKATGAGNGVSLSDLKHDGGPMFGVKLGGYLRNNIVGGELEGFFTRLNFPSQSVTATGPGGSATALLDSGHQNVWTGAINLLLRYPGSRLQPYAGVGVALVHLEDVGSGDTAPGLNVLAGLRGKITEHLSLFGEFKYVRASFDVSSLSGAGNIGAKFDVNMPAVVFGAALHF